MGKNINDSIVRILTVFMLILNVFFAFPNLILLINRKDKKYPFLCALFFAVLGFFFTPHMSGDYTRIISRVNYLEPKIIFLQADIFLPILVYLVSYFNLSKRVIGFTSAFILYYFILKSLYIVSKNRRIKNREILNFIIFISSIPIISYTGVRFSTGLSFFIYGIVIFYFEKYEKSAYFFLVIAICCHYSFFFPVIIFFLCLKKLSMKKAKFILFMSILSGIIMTPEILLIIAQLINNIFDNNIISKVYITGEWGNNYLNEKSLLSKIIYYFNRICETIILTYYIFGLKVYNNKNLKIVIIIFSGILYFLVFSYSEVSNRFFLIILLLIILETLNSKFLAKGNFKIKILYIFILIHNFLKICIDIYLQHESFIISYSEFYKINLLNCIINLK